MLSGISCSSFLWNVRQRTHVVLLYLQRGFAHIPKEFLVEIVESGKRCDSFKPSIWKLMLKKNTKQMTELHKRDACIVRQYSAYRSKTTLPFEPTAKSGRSSWLWSKDDELIDMPKYFRSFEPTILWENRNISTDTHVCLKINLQKSRRPCTLGDLLNFWLCLMSHLWVDEADAPHAFAMEYVDAAMTIILQRSSNGQIVEAICVNIRQYSKRGAKPSILRFVPSQY